MHCVSFSHRRDSYIHIHERFRNKNLHKLKCYLIKLVEQINQVIDNGHHFEMNTIVRKEHKNKSKSSTNFGLLKTLFRNSVTKSELYVFYGRTIFMDDFKFKQVISIEYYPKNICEKALFKRERHLEKYQFVSFYTVHSLFWHTFLVFFSECFSKCFSKYVPGYVFDCVFEYIPIYFFNDFRYSKKYSTTRSIVIQSVFRYP